VRRKTAYLAKRIRTAFAVGLLVTGLSSCTNSALGESPTDSGTQPGYPVTISGKLGTATVQKPATRVVAMDWTDADIALALGVRPVGMAQVSTAPGGIEPWTESLLGKAKPTLFDTDSGDPVDKVAALNPDLILATKDYNLTQSYQQLSQIAPVVSYVDAPNSDSWQEDTLNIAKALGKTAQARQAIAKVGADISAARQEHPQWNGKTYNFLVTPQADGVYAVNSTQDASARFLSTLGLTLSPTVRTMPTSGIPGRTLVSWENIAQLNADLLVATGPPSSLKLMSSMPGFQNLPAVRRQRYLALQPTLAQAIAFPSSASLEWALGQLTPLLDKAVTQ
jgi:iron complex transport system substrate-binding protein